MTDAKADCRILVFARAPIAGRVKTRLIPALGAEGAAALQRRLALRAIETACSAKAGPVELWCAPATHHPFFLDCARRFGLPLFEQGRGDLGERMHRALGFIQPVRAILVGSDIPALTADYLEQAAGALDEGHDVVLGPAEDGGYVLIGLGRQVPELFHDMPWGSATVLDETRLRIAALALRSCELSPLWDLDRPEDLERLARLQN